MDLSTPQESDSAFQKIDKASILAQCPLFSGLSQWELKSIGQLMRLVEFKRDETVYSEGRPGDSFYVVVSGRLEAYITPPAGKKKVLAYLRRGDHFGEMSLLTKEPHSATVRALSDSLVLELKKEDFERTIEHNARISLELSRRLSHRLRGDNKSAKSLFRSDVISVFSHQPKNSRAHFSINLAASLFHESHQKTILIDLAGDESDSVPGFDSVPKARLSEFRGLEDTSNDIFQRTRKKHESGFDFLSLQYSESSESVMISLLNHLAIEYRFIVLDLPNEMSALSFKTLTQSDFIFLCTDSHMTNIQQAQSIMADLERTVPASEGRRAVVMEEVFFGVRTTSLVRQELFAKKRCFSLPATPLLTDKMSVRQPLVVHDPDTDYSRVVRHIARYVSNNLVGLVLGSGAAFGLAHVGVLKVLQREKIPIDVIAGSSIGALVGGVYAVCQDAAQVEKMALEITPRMMLWKLIDFSLYPVRGLLNSRGVMKHLRKHLGDATFENCRIPLKVTGVNLSTRQSFIFDSGLILDAVRASISIPAIFKPVFIGGETIIDGGILDPLPIKALHDAGVHKIIAVNVFPTSKDTLEKRLIHEDAAQREEQSVKRKNILARCMHRLKKTAVKCFFPNVFDILMNTIQFMESELAEIEGGSADVLIRPVLPTASWVDFFKPEPFIRRGEEETMRLLPKIKALVAQQNA